MLVVHFWEVLLAACIYCGAQTQLYSSGQPVCVDCSNDLDAGRKPPSKERVAPAKAKAQANR